MAVKSEDVFHASLKRKIASSNPADDDCFRVLMNKKAQATCTDVRAPSLVKQIRKLNTNPYPYPNPNPNIRGTSLTMNIKMH